MILKIRTLFTSCVTFKNNPFQVTVPFEIFLNLEKVSHEKLVGHSWEIEIQVSGIC